jgi:hypothetical protein
MEKENTISFYLTVNDCKYKSLIALGTCFIPRLYVNLHTQHFSFLKRLLQGSLQKKTRNSLNNL